jgi:hypothetical protein
VRNLLFQGVKKSVRSRPARPRLGVLPAATGSSAYRIRVAMEHRPDTGPLYGCAGGAADRGGPAAGAAGPGPGGQGLYVASNRRYLRHRGIEATIPS